MEYPPEPSKHAGLRTVLAFARANPGMGYREARRLAEEAAAEHHAQWEQRKANVEANRMQRGTGPKYIARYERTFADTGRLTRAEKSAVRRAIMLGKTVPETLRKEVEQ